MVDYVYRKKAYKAARERVRNAMLTKKLEKPAIIAIAKQVLDSQYPNAGVNMDDLINACLYYQEGISKNKE